MAQALLAPRSSPSHVTLEPAFSSVTALEWIGQLREIEPARVAYMPSLTAGAEIRARQVVSTRGLGAKAKEKIERREAAGFVPVAQVWCPEARQQELENFTFSTLLRCEPPRDIAAALQRDLGVNVDADELIDRIGKLKKRFDKRPWSAEERVALDFELGRNAIYDDPTIDVGRAEIQVQQNIKAIRKAMGGRPKRQIIREAKALVASGAAKRWADRREAQMG
jgi:hypothetical protein